MPCDLFGKNKKLIDLTHSLTETIPNWTMECGFKKTIVRDYQDCAANEVKFKVQKIECFSGIGTHIDAPAHCIPHGKSIAEIPLAHLFAPCVVIDVSKIMYARYCVSAEDIHAFEKRYGVIQNDAFVMVYTGWSQYWTNPIRYRNDLVFPSISLEAAELLLQRNIVGLGIDTLSPDCGNSDFPVHQAILGAGKYIIENIAYADQMPAVGGYIIALPLKIEEGTESPVRLIGLCGH